MRNVIIDPMMFALTEESLIEANIPFYMDIIDLLQDNHIRICRYTDMESCLGGAYDDGRLYPPPFPVKLSRISSPRLREECNRINYLFIKRILDEGNNACFIDIDDCGGEQNCRINEEYYQDEELRNLQLYLLTECYQEKSQTERIDEHILSGRLPDGMMIRHVDLELHCSCNSKPEYNGVFHFTWPGDLRTPEAALKKELKDRLITEGISKQTPNLVLDGTHHCYIQKSKPRNYRELTRANRSVLKHLEYFGLKEVHLRDAIPSSGEIGSIVISSSCEMESGSFACGQIVGEEGNAAHVELEFPDRIGSLLTSILGDQWTEQTVRSLKDQIVS